MQKLSKLFNRNRYRRVANAPDPVQSQQPDTFVSSDVQSFDPPPIATSPQNDTVDLGDVQLFESHRSATPRAVAASAPAKTKETPPQITAASTQNSTGRIPKLTDKYREYREEIKRRIHKEQINMEKYNIRYFLYREYELSIIAKMSSSKRINVVLKSRLKPPFYPSVLNNSVIDLLKRELESTDYKRLYNLINSDETKKLRANKGGVEEIDIKPLLISNFLSKITIIDLDEHVVDKFTLEVLKSIDKSKVFIISLHNINFNNDIISCNEFLNYLEEYKDHTKLKNLIVCNIDIKGNHFEKFIDIIGELKSITFLCFIGFDIPWAMEFDEKEYFSDMFMKTLIKLENLKMLIFNNNYINEDDFKEIFITSHKLLLSTKDNKDLIDFYEYTDLFTKEEFEKGGYTKSYDKVFKTTGEEGKLNYRMSISPLTNNANKIVESSRKSFHFTALNNGNNDPSYEDFDDILIKRNYEKIKAILKERKDDDTKAIQEAMRKQQEQDAVNNMNKQKNVLQKYSTSIAIMKQADFEATEATRRAHEATANNPGYHSKKLISDAIKKSRNATKALEIEKVMGQLAKTAANDAKASSMKIKALRAAQTTQATQAAQAAQTTYSSSSRSSSSISSKIEELKNSGSSSNSPKEETSKGGKKKLSSDNKACNTKIKSR